MNLSEFLDKRDKILVKIKNQGFGDAIIVHDTELNFELLFDPTQYLTLSLIHNRGEKVYERLDELKQSLENSLSIEVILDIADTDMQTTDAIYLSSVTLEQLESLYGKDWRFSDTFPIRPSRVQQTFFNLNNVHTTRDKPTPEQRKAANGQLAKWNGEQISLLGDNNFGSNSEPSSSFSSGSS